MKGSYDNVALFYDLLARSVYGKAILDAHRFLADAVPADRSVLVVGGGTGQLLEEMSKIHKGGLQITYVDISKKMIEISKKRNIRNNEVTFINESILHMQFHQQFDVVITPFVFDNFSDNTTKFLFDKIDALINGNGLWLFADFQKGEKNKVWQKFLLKSMYFFFRLLCGIEAAHLPDTASLFEKYNYRLIDKRTFYKDFIYSSIYLKPGTWRQSKNI